MSKINLTKVKPEVVAKYLKKHKLDRKGTTEEQVLRLEAHQNEQTPKERLVSCDVCEGYSDGDLTECPYCGSAEEVVGDKPAKEAKPKAEKPAKEAKPKAEPKQDGKRAVATKAEEKPKTKPAKELKPKLALAKPAKADAPVTVAGKAEVLSAKTLDGEVKAIRKAQEAGGAALFELGRRLKTVEERGLYTLRLDADGKRLYKTFSAFCEQELGINKKYAQRIIDVADRFSVDDVKTIGISKLSMLVNIEPGEQLQSLLSKAAETPREEFAKEIARLEPPRGGRRREGYHETEGSSKAAAERAAQKRAESALKSERLTIVSADAEYLLDLFPGDLMAEWQPGMDLPAANAASVGERPTAAHIAANGVVTRYELIQKPDGGLAIMVKHERK